MISLEARISTAGSIGNYIDITDAIDPSEGRFTLGLAQLKELNGGGDLLSGEYTVEVLARSASGEESTRTLSYNYNRTVYDEYDQVPLDALTAVDLGHGRTGYQFQIADLNTLDTGVEELLVYLVDANDPSQTLLNGNSGQPLMTITKEGQSYDTHLVQIDGENVTLTLPNDLQDAALFYGTVTVLPPNKNDVADSAGASGSGSTAGDSVSPYSLGSPGGNRARSGYGRRSSSGGSSGGSGNSDSVSLLNYVKGDGFYVTYEQPEETAVYTVPSKIVFGDNVLTFTSDEINGNSGTDSMKKDLIEVIVASIDASNPYGLDGDKIQRVYDTEPFSSSAAKLTDAWTRGGNIALGVNKDLDFTQQKPEQKKLLDFQVSLAQAFKNVRDLESVKSDSKRLQEEVQENTQLLPEVFKLGNNLLKNENSLLDFIDLYSSGSVIEVYQDTFDDSATENRTYEILANALVKSSVIDPDSEFAWLAAIVYSEAMTAKNNDESLDKYLFAETILNQAEIINSGNNERSVAQRFGQPYDGSIIKGLVSGYNAGTTSYSSYEGDFYDEFMLGLTDGFSGSVDQEIAEKALSSVSDALLKEDAAVIAVELFYRPVPFHNGFHADVVVTNSSRGGPRKVYWGSPEIGLLESISFDGYDQGLLLALDDDFIPDSIASYRPNFYEQVNNRMPTIIYEDFASYKAQEIEGSIYDSMVEMEKWKLEYNILGPNSNTMARYALLNTEELNVSIDYIPPDSILPGWGAITPFTPTPPADPYSEYPRP